VGVVIVEFPSILRLIRLLSQFYLSSKTCAASENVSDRMFRMLNQTELTAKQEEILH
jgi:hypothetical protein